MEMMLTQTDMPGKRGQIGLIGMMRIQIPDNVCNPFIIVHACTLLCGDDCNHPLLAVKIRGHPPASEGELCHIFFVFFDFMCECHPKAGGAAKWCM